MCINRAKYWQHLMINYIETALNKSLMLLLFLFESRGLTLQSITDRETF